MNSARRLAALAGITLLASGCAGFFGGLHHYSSGGSGSGGSGGSSPDAYDCPTSDSASSIARVTSLRPGAGARGRALAHTVSSPVQPNLLAVTYDARTFAQNPGGYAAREQSAGATFVREYDFTHAGLVTRIVRPSSGSLASLEAALRALPGVRNVGATGYHRHLDSVSQPYVTNDPIFDGDGASAPLYETSSTEGQWDMHAARLEYAFAYSQSGNGSSVTNANALGSSNIKVAIVDSGVDTSQPDLENASGNSKVVYRKRAIPRATAPTLPASRRRSRTTPSASRAPAATCRSMRTASFRRRTIPASPTLRTSSARPTPRTSPPRSKTRSRRRST
jgi:hypothetical protein